MKPKDPQQGSFDFDTFVLRHKLPPRKVTARVAARLTGRARRIMDRLYEGPAETFELWRVGGSGMSARINELRNELERFGWEIACVEREEGATYTLRSIE